MPRIIGKNVKNAFHVKDSVSGDVLTLFFRIPSPEDRVLYEGDKYERTEKGIRINLSKARQKWGMVILEGVKEGSFLVKGEDGGLKPLISEPGNPGFTEGWEDLLLKQAPDVIEAMAAHIFDGHTVVVQQEEFYPEKNS